MLRRFVICVVALVLAAAWPSVVLAHPLGNFTISHYNRIEVEPSRVCIFYVLDMAEIPTFQVMQSTIDQDRDGQMSQSELESYAQTKAAVLASNLQLLVNEQPVAGKLSARNVLAVGISGGLAPCPAGIIVMLSAIGLGRLGFGLGLIVAFSLGLALVLTAVGLVVLYSRQWLSKQRADARITQALPVLGGVLARVSAFSGVLVIGAGMLLLYHAWPFLRVWWG